MGTSRSADWTAEALLFSGRPNPRWQVDPAAAAGVLAVWERLASRSGPAAVPPPLGSRGCALRSPDGSVWRSVAGTVTLHASGRPAEARDDRTREFERALLATAPPGIVPAIPPDRSDPRP